MKRIFLKISLIIMINFHVTAHLSQAMEHESPDLNNPLKDFESKYIEEQENTYKVLSDIGSNIRNNILEKEMRQKELERQIKELEKLTNHLATVIVDSGKPFDLFKNECLDLFDGESLIKIESMSPILDEHPNTKCVGIKTLSYKFSSTDYYEKETVRQKFATDYNLYAQRTDNSQNYYTYGYLTIPKNGVGPFPCAVLCHGSSGAKEFRYADSLAEQGIASLLIHRFFNMQYVDKEGGVHYVNDTLQNQLCISLESEIIQTFSAVKLMASHPKVDPTKIGFIGWSRGGNVALECSYQHNIDAILPGFKPAFCVNYYTMPLVQKKICPQGPVLFLHGANDDYTPLSRLANYINYISDLNIDLKTIQGHTSLGNDKLKLIVYPNAGHAFDTQTTWSSVKNIESFFEFICYKHNEIWGNSFKESRVDFMNLSDCCSRALGNGSGFMCLQEKTEYTWDQFSSYITKKIKYGVTLEFNHQAGLEAWQEALSFIKLHTTNRI